MKLFQILSVALALMLSLASTSLAVEKEFDTEKIMEELEEQMRLGSEKLSLLKPTIDEKSQELKKSLHESVEQGFIQMDELSTKLESVSKEAEAKVKELLTSEEYAKFKAHLEKVDKEAIAEAKNRLVEDLSSFMELTEEQARELKPLLEETVQNLNQMVETLAEEGVKNWGEFKEKYELLQKDLKQQLESFLDGEQMEKLDEYNKEKIQKIKDKLIEV